MTTSQIGKAAQEPPTRTSGEELRERIHAQFTIDGVPAEVLIDQICSTADEIAVLEAALADEGALIEGARGQLVASPALAALARHRALLGKLLQQAFPEQHESATELASRAARARWHARRRTS